MHTQEFSRQEKYLVPEMPTLLIASPKHRIKVEVKTF
jgi:hypothetical protein